MKPYYSHGGIELYVGDCRKVLPTLTTRSAACVLTDPPYSKHVHGNGRRTKKRTTETAPTGNDVSEARDLGFEHIADPLMRFCAGEFARIATRWTLVFSDIESCDRWRGVLTAAGLQYVRTGVWVRNGAPQFTGDRPAVGFETVTIAHPKGRKRWNGGGASGVWNVPILRAHDTTEERIHTTQKPLALMRQLVELFTDPGELVLDPFAGAGTTLVACAERGRRAIGIELDEAIAERAAKRLEAVARQPTLFQSELPINRRATLLRLLEPECSS